MVTLEVTGIRIVKERATASVFESTRLGSVVDCELFGKGPCGTCESRLDLPWNAPLLPYTLDQANRLVPGLFRDSAAKGGLR
jgi:hypothetical protein